MRILLTGSTGFVGSHVAEALSDAGHTVRCLVRPESSRRWLRGLAEERLEWAIGDLAGSGLDAAVEGTDAVVHLAGSTRGSRREIREVNVRGTERLLAACVRSGRKELPFIFGSSQAAAGPSLGGRPRRESDAPSPRSTYGITKLEAERLVELGVGWHPVILRFATIYGPRDRDTLPMFRLAARGWIVVPRSGKGPQFHLIHVRDAASAVVLALARAEAEGASLFVAHPRACTWDDLASALGAAAGDSVRALRVPRFLGLAAGAVATVVGVGRRRPGVLDFRRARYFYESWLCDVSRAQALLDWTAQTDLTRGLAQTLEWYRQAGWL